MMRNKQMPHWVVRLSAFFLRQLLLLRYRIRVTETSFFETNSSVLFLPNHQSLLDPIVLVLWGLKYRCFVSPVVTEEYFENPLFRFFLTRINALPVPNLEKGKRDFAVLEKINTHVLANFSHGRNVLLYPSGRLSNNENEVIGNKQSAYALVRQLPAEVWVVAVQNHNFWNTRWSKKESGKTPDFLKIFLQDGLYVLFHGFVFLKRIPLTVTMTDITAEAKEKAQTLSRHDFNRYLESIYNAV